MLEIVLLRRMKMETAKEMHVENTKNAEKDPKSYDLRP